MYIPPIGPHALLCTCMVLEHLHVVGVCYLLKCVLGQLPYTTPIWECLPLNYTPTLHCWFPVHCYSQGYQFLMWAFPLLLKGLGCSPHYLGRLGAHQLSSCPCALSCTSTYQFFQVRPLPLSVLYLCGVVLGYCLHVSIFTS